MWGFPAGERLSTAQDQCVFTVLPLDSGQCLIICLEGTHICIACTSAEMAAETLSGPINIDIE